MRAVRKAAVLVLLGLILGAPWAAALEARSETSPQESRSTTRSTFDLLDTLWRFFNSIWLKEGCTGDPLGGCSVGDEGGTQAPTSKAGCTIDPLGACRP